MCKREVVKSAVPGVHHQECSYPVRHSTRFTLINGGQRKRKEGKKKIIFVFFLLSLLLSLSVSLPPATIASSRKSNLSQ